MYRKLERQVSRTMDNRKLSLPIIHALTEKRRFKIAIIYVFGSSTKFQRGMTGFVKADICRQVSVCLRVFCGILLALKLLRDYSLYSVWILPQSAFYSQSVDYILYSVCFLPLVRSLQSAVRSPESAVFVLHWPFSKKEVKVSNQSTSTARPAKHCRAKNKFAMDTAKNDSTYRSKIIHGMNEKRIRIIKTKITHVAKNNY